MKPKTLPQFPGCEINWCEQRSDEWFEARMGVLTATSFGPWLLKTDKTSAKARENAICKTLASMARMYELPVFENDAMTRGTALEPLAVADFTAATGIDITEANDRELTELRRTTIGFVFQNFNLIGSLTAEQNVSMPLRLAGRRPQPGVAGAERSRSLHDDIG